MDGTKDSDSVPAAQPDFDHYLPATPDLSAVPGPVERFVTNLFRRRGGLRVVVRRKQ